MSYAGEHLHSSSKDSACLADMETIGCPLQALDNLQCKRRVLLSGTPMQNYLDEASNGLPNAA